MYDILKDNDLIITDNKDRIFDYLFTNKKLINIKIMSKQEFINEFFGTYDERAIYYLCHRYHYKYNVAKTYLDNFLFNETLKKELDDNNLIIYNNKFKENIKRIIIDNVYLDPYIMNAIKQYENIKLENDIKMITKTVYEADNIEDEINFVILKILDLIKSVNIDRIHLLNVGSEYYLPIKRLFSFYNIPINMNDDKSIYTDLKIKEFLVHLSENKNMESALSIIEKENYYNKILSICNKFAFTECDDIVVALIQEKIKELKIESPKIKNAIDITDKVNSDDYYFILGFNQNEFIKTYKDDDFISDNEKEKLGIFTSIEKNKLEKENIKKILSENENIIISYKTHYLGEERYPSRLIDECGFKVQKICVNSYNYSNVYNKIELAKSLDEYLKFNVINDNLNLLYSNYEDIPYMNYDNKFTGINLKDFYDYIDNHLVLSYTSLNNYNNCAFKYYLDNILKLDFEKTFHMFVGDLFHYILSKCFNDGFDFEKEYNEYLKDKELSEKEKCMLEILKNKLKEAIDVISKQNETSSLNKELYEQKIYVEKQRKIKFLFMGVIDKIKYSLENNQMNAIIVDYKTGELKNKMDNLPYGIDIQLPIYLYLLKNSQFKNVRVAGFYLQSVIPKKEKYDFKKDESKKILDQYKLNGYTNSDIKLVEKIDKYYTKSEVIKGMEYKDNKFGRYAKVLNDEQIDYVVEMVSKNIDKTLEKIENGEFDINPKKQDGNIDACNFCKYKDICFKTQKDFKYLDKYSFEKELGGE